MGDATGQWQACLNLQAIHMVLLMCFPWGQARAKHPFLLALDPGPPGSGQPQLALPGGGSIWALVLRYQGIVLKYK